MAKGRWLHLPLGCLHPHLCCHRRQAAGLSQMKFSFPYLRGRKPQQPGMLDFSQVFRSNFFSLDDMVGVALSWGAGARHSVARWPCWPQLKHLIGGGPVGKGRPVGGMVMGHRPNRCSPWLCLVFSSAMLHFFYCFSLRSIIMAIQYHL